MKSIRIKFKIDVFDMLTEPAALITTLHRDDWAETLDTIRKLREGTPQMTKDKPPRAFNVEMVVMVVEELETKTMTMFREYDYPLPF